jgi:hypothetical protein
MKSHSSGNGNQSKLLERELRRAEKLADRLDRTLALADRELGADPRFPNSYSRIPAPDPRLPMAAGTEVVPAPTSGDRPLAPGSVPRGEFEATFGVSGTPIPSGFLYDLGEYNPELA